MNGCFSACCGSDFRASLDNVQATFFVLPDCRLPAKTLADAASGGEDGGRYQKDFQHSLLRKLISR